MYYIYIYIYVCMYMYMYLYIHRYIHIYIYLASAFVRMCVAQTTYIHVNQAHMHSIRACMHADKHIPLQTCVS